MNTGPTIRVIPSTAVTDIDLLQRIVVLVNDVYATAEAGMWRPGTPRTDVEEIVAAVGRGEIVVAEQDDRLVGVVHTNVTEGTGWLGMLAVHPDYRSAGVGRRLVDLTEEGAASTGAGAMEIEVLTPLDGSNVSKVELDRWYRRLGYEHIRDDDLAEHHATLGDLLAIPSTLKVYRKSLPAGKTDAHSPAVAEDQGLSGTDSAPRCAQS